MDRKTFDEGFKLLKRFLKNEGLYSPVMKFIFRNGRPKENLFEEFNSTKYNDVDDWKVLFIKVNLMDSPKKDFWLGSTYDKYLDLIGGKNLQNKWPNFYQENTPPNKE